MPKYSEENMPWYDEGQTEHIMHSNNTQDDFNTKPYIGPITHGSSSRAAVGSCIRFECQVRTLLVENW